MSITHVFFDIGGVLGTNGWDSEQRLRAIDRFALDPEFECRHEELAGDWENGRLTLAEYLESAVFFTPRPFTSTWPCDTSWRAALRVLARPSRKTTLSSRVSSNWRSVSPVTPRFCNAV